MNTHNHLLHIAATIMLCTTFNMHAMSSPEKSGSKKRSNEEAFQILINSFENLNLNAMDLIVEAPIEQEPLKQKLCTTTRKKEEDRLLAEYTALVLRRNALREVKEKLGYEENEYTLQEQEAINLAFELHEQNSADLRLQWEFNPNMDLKDPNWKTNAYWNPQED